VGCGSKLIEKVLEDILHNYLRIDLKPIYCQQFALLD